MSILDHLTDDGLKRLVATRETQIERLNEMLRCLRADRDRLSKFNDAKTRRIVALTEEIAELKKGVMND